MLLRELIFSRRSFLKKLGVSFIGVVFYDYRQLDALMSLTTGDQDMAYGSRLYGQGIYGGVSKVSTSVYLPVITKERN